MKVKENLLPEEAIFEGSLIYYEGRTSMWEWSCPAVIIDVNNEKRTFRVISLDDMREQKQEYDFDVREHTPDSRCSMFIPTNERLAGWLRQNGYDFRTTGIKETDHKEWAGPDYEESYLVGLDVDKFPKVVTWIVERWCQRNNIPNNTFSAIGFSNNVLFKKSEDAVLFNIAFSSGVPWDKVR